MAGIDVLDIGRRYAAAMEQKTGAVPELFADEVFCWWNTNTAGRTTNGKEMAVAINHGHPGPANWRVEVDSVRAMENGFVVSLAVRADQKDGTPVSAHVCQIVTLNDEGLICKWEEFVDQKQHEAING